MGATKYRVGQEYNGKIHYYGHYPANDVNQAIQKAYHHNNGVRPFDVFGVFYVKRGEKQWEVTGVRLDG